MAQSCGLIPRQIFILLPEGPLGATKDTSSEAGASVTNMNTTDDVFAVGQPQISLSDLQKYREFFVMKEVTSAYVMDHMKVCTL